MWFLQNILSSAAWDIVMALVGGISLATLRVKWPSIAAPVMYGFAGTTIVAVLIFALTGHAILVPHEIEITPDNVEASVREWADEFGLGVTKSVLPNSFWALTTTLRNGNC